jgi:predicted hydrocarbon binding protein
MGIFERTGAELLNPGIKVTQTKIMTAGDPYCEIVFEEE